MGLKLVEPCILAMHGSDIAILNSSFVGNSAANCSNAQVCFGGVVYAENAYIQGVKKHSFLLLL